MFYATRCLVYWGLTHDIVFCWYSDLISHTQTNTNIHKGTQHTQGPVDQHSQVNIYLHQLLCAHRSYLCLTEWIIHLQKSYLLIRCYKSRFFLWNTNNNDRNGVNKQNTHTHTHTHTHQTLRERYIIWERVSMKIRYTFFFKIIPLPFYGKNLNWSELPSFFKIFENSDLPLEGRLQLW